MKRIAILLFVCWASYAQYVPPAGSGGGGGGSGTVTSVGFTVPSWLSVAGSPLTTSGTIAVSAATGQTTARFLATCNGATSIALCAPAAADLPNMPESQITNLVADLASKGTRTASITDLAPVVGDSGLILVLNPPTAVHLTRAFCTVQGTTNVVLNLDARTEATIGTDSAAHLLGSDLTAVAGGAHTSTFSSSPCGGTSSCAVAAHVPVVMTFTSVSDTPTALNCSVDYTVD